VNGSEGGPAAAERQLLAAEARVARQAAVAEGFELAGDTGAAERAKEVLAILEVGLALARLLMAVELASPDNEPSRRLH
jgi:hypothetical protein